MRWAISVSAKSCDFKKLKVYETKLSMYHTGDVITHFFKILIVCKEGQNCQEFLLTEWAFKKWV